MINTIKTIIIGIFVIAYVVESLFVPGGTDWFPHTQAALISDGCAFILLSLLILSLPNNKK